MITFGVDASEIEELAHSLENPNLTAVGDAMEQSLAGAASVWRLAASGGRLPGMTRTAHSDAYAKSITYAQRGLLAGVVYSASEALDAGMQSARPAWNMKPGLLGGPKARQGARGRYNIIPIRHRPENLSNEAVMALIQNLRNFRTEQGIRSKTTARASGATGVYRGAKPIPGTEGVPTAYTWTTGPESGIRMGDSGPVTFRTVSDRSAPSSWWYPARPANDIASAVWEIIAESVGDRLLFAWMEALGL